MKATLKKIFPVIFVTVVVFLAVALLSWTNSITKDKIESQEEEQIQSMLGEMFPDMSRYAFEDDIYTVYSDETQLGYAFLALGKGYGGNINILVGLENETTIKGISIISQSETPGLGARVSESSFVNEFAGLSIGDVALRQDGGQVDAITGATISSGAVVDAVRATAVERVKSLQEKEGSEND